MSKIKTAEEASRRWVENSIQANPDRIHGVIRVYFQGRQNLKWVTGLLKGEDAKLVKTSIDAFKKVDPVKYEALLQELANSGFPVIFGDDLQNK